MENLKEKLLQDFKQALKDKDGLKKDIIQVCRAAILQVEKDKQVELDDLAIIDILNKEWKKRQEALKLFSADHVDAIEKLKAEISVIEIYLPQRLSSEELRLIVAEEIKLQGATSLKDMGSLMKALSIKLQGKADGGDINKCIKDLLS